MNVLRRFIFALYVLALVASPIVHHDIECHEKTPTHCTACMASPIAAPSVPVLFVWSGPLPDAGEVAVARIAPVALFERTFVSGRAPPA